MNPIPDGDIYIRQMNTVPLGTDPQTVNDSAPPEDDTAVSGKKERSELQVNRLREIAVSAAERCVRKEIAGLKDLARKKADEDAIDKFYLDHSEFLTKAMSMSRDGADEYTRASKSWIKVEGIEQCILRVEQEGALALGMLAFGEANAEFSYLSTLAQSMRINQLHSGGLLKKKIKLLRDSDGRVTDATVEVIQ